MFTDPAPLNTNSEKKFQKRKCTWYSGLHPCVSLLGPPVSPEHLDQRAPLSFCPQKPLVESRKSGRRESSTSFPQHLWWGPWPLEQQGRQSGPQKPSGARAASLPPLCNSSEFPQPRSRWQCFQVSSSKLELQGQRQLLESMSTDTPSLWRCQPVQYLCVRMPALGPFLLKRCGAPSALLSGRGYSAGISYWK